MEVDIEDSSCISLTSSDDGILRSERLSIASDILSFENACTLYRTVPTDDNLCMHVTGTGLCLVSISYGETKGIPLYMLKLRHTSSVDILFHLNKHGKQVISTFNNESLETGVDPSNPTLAKLTILEGQFTNSFTLNGVIVQKQICEMAKGEPPSDNSEIITTETPSFSNDVDETIAKITEEKEANDDKGDISSGIDDGNDNNSGDTEKITEDFQAVTANEGVIDDTSHDRDSQQGMEDALNKAEAQHLLEHIFPNFQDVDICIDDSDDDDVPWILVSGSDDIELNMPESTNDKLAMPCDDVQIGKPAVYGCYQSKGNFNREGAVVKGRPENIALVDIRTDRTNLINIMNSNMLANYLFEAQLISEYDMNKVKDIWKRESHTEANERLLEILRNRRVSYSEMEDVLEKAEEQHLLEHIFVKYQDVESCPDDSDNYDIPWILVSGGDDIELNMPESTNDKFVLFCNDVPTRTPAVYGCFESKGNFNRAVVKGRPENHDIVDIRTNRTELINKINSNMLANYLFEAQLITEYDMNEVKEIWKREIHTEANERLLQILRNRRVAYRDMKVVLEKADDQYLLELLFPKYQGIESYIDDADVDDIPRNSLSCSDDRQSNMSKSMNDEHTMLSADVPTGKPVICKCNRGQDNCSKEGAMVKGRPQNLDIVDIRTKRTDLLHSMTSKFLTDYLFEANLINEYNMKEVKEISKKESEYEANVLLLEILRNRRVSYREMEVVLEKAGEIHLLTLMFPKYQDMKEIERFTDDANDKPLITEFCGDDRESNVSEATTYEYSMFSADVLNNDEKGEPVSGKPTVCRAYQTQCCCSKEGEKVKRQPENLGMVDIRTNRTELMNIMNSSMLANYFFEGELISEYDMNEVDEIWKKESYIEANERLLRILRNKKVPKRKIEVILYRAEEPHLSELMFPKQLNFGSVQPKQ